MSDLAPAAPRGCANLAERLGKPLSDLLIVPENLRWTASLRWSRLPGSPLP